MRGFATYRSSPLAFARARACAHTHTLTPSPTQELDAALTALAAAEGDLLWQWQQGGPHTLSFLRDSILARQMELVGLGEELEASGEAELKLFISTHLPQEGGGAEGTAEESTSNAAATTCRYLEG